MNTWPDGAMTPFRSEKNTNWEGAFRVPEVIRWPGRIPAGVVSNAARRPQMIDTGMSHIGFRRVVRSDKP